ncbi:MAG TPA: aspartate-semialdehyde dehydrogenase [Candidatus Paceibacterota bacterium]|nr:aspartate-semialdehyde dehydrogenase [Candidatus Paceibacterota bacterium]
MTAKKIPVGILGATGMVGQRFVALLKDHPWFETVYLAASERSAGKTYAEAVAGKWAQQCPVPDAAQSLTVHSIEKDLDAACGSARIFFSAIGADKDLIRKIEERYAAKGALVISNNSAHRWTEDVPVIMPEINPEHLRMIEIQRKNRGWKTGCIVAKPNCSIQSYVPLLHAWKRFEPLEAVVSTYQAISGAGKTFAGWPEMIDNVMPFIKGEEEKSEKEPMKIWAKMENGTFVPADVPRISANCIRVPVSDGHTAAINIRFGRKPSKSELIEAIRNFKNPLDGLNLPSSPKQFIEYFDEDDRPQARLDRDFEGGMGITAGRLREDPVLGWKCVALSHNTVRGAAGGAILIAELMVEKGYLENTIFS